LSGLGTVVGLARLHGYTIGILASDPEHLGGALTASGCEKIIRHVKICETFNLPVLNFVDCPGFYIGKQSEEDGTIRKGADLLEVLYTTRAPFFSCIVRKCFGVGGAALAISEIKIAWPSGDWGSLPLEGGIEAGFRRRLQGSENIAEMRADLERKLEAVRSPIRTAEKFGVPEIIDPRNTRRRTCEWVEIIYQNVLPQLVGRKARL
jgi:acetyl-CoA carboxylase carboxyltransferase component